MKRWIYTLIASVSSYFLFTNIVFAASSNEDASKLTSFLTNPAVVTILITIAILGFVYELFSQGIGVAGFVAILAVALFFYGHMVAGIADMTSIVFFVIGIILVFLEFFLPGAIAGILGFGLVVTSFVLATNDATLALTSLTVAVVLGAALFFVLYKIFGKKVKFYSSWVLTDSTSSEKGYVSNQVRTDLVGKEGIANSDLRPAGTVFIGSERIDAVTEGNFISRGTRVIVLKNEGARIVVREIN